MSKYIKLFENHAQYETFIGGGGGDTPFVRPNVSHCIAENEVHYNPTWDNEYFTTVAREKGTISFNILNSIDTNKIKSISYSTDNGATWTTTKNQDKKDANLSISVTVNEGDKILWKGIAGTLGFYDDDEESVLSSFFSSTAKFDVAGNVMSLLFGADFKGQTDLTGKDYAFSKLFSSNSNLVNAQNLSLPATTLAEYCYQDMFNGCTSLVTAPTLPAETLANSCYYEMFYGCTSLVNAPVLPATTLAFGCYQQMFRGCTGLTTAPELPATTLANYCYDSMFRDCTSLVTAPELPATILTAGCYGNMFYGCTGLVNAPELPATTLADSCYYFMFNDCRRLVNAPQLPATTLAKDCYSNMFKGCTSLTTAPELSATTLVDRCYISMFNGCSLLNYIKAMFTTTPGTLYTYNWVSGVASTGKFVKNSAATWNVSGVSGVPTGWTIERATE